MVIEVKQTSPGAPPQGSSWLQAVSNWLGRVWTKITHIPSYFSDLASRISLYVKNFFQSKEPPASAKPLQNVTVINPDKLEENPLAGLLNPKKLPDNIDPTLLPNEDIKIPQRNPMINVPDDGNCLFYAVAVGLKKKFNQNPDIQKKLSWNSELQKLEGDLSKQEELFSSVGKHLRQQAADLLTTQSDYNIVVEDINFNAIPTYNEKVEREIRETRMALPYLSTKDEQKIKEKEIKELEKKFIPEGDIAAYIERSKENGFYCGASQIRALSEVYKIPIVLWEPIEDAKKIEEFEKVVVNGKELKPEKINGKFFAPIEVFGKFYKQSALEIIFVNRNHYMYKDN